MTEIIVRFWYFWLIIAALAVLRIFRPQLKGWLGEKIIARKLSRLPKKQYSTLNDLLFKTETGTTQVDHVVVSVYGVFVIETKNYKGWIFGGDHEKEWTQVIYGNKRGFMNPIRQNYAHIKAVEARLSDYPELPVVGIIAFSPACTLKTKTEYNVVYFQNINKVIKKYRDKKLDESELEAAVSRVSDADINSFANSRAHIKQVKEKRKHETEVSETMKCPKCGGELVLRTGKYGNFYGCSNYPKCKYTE